MSQPLPSEQSLPHTALDAEAVRVAYRRWARIYDTAFGAVTSMARCRAVTWVNTLPGTRVLEVGVGTGLALPLYVADSRITGIDLSTEMLAIARQRVARQHLTNVEALHEMDAEATSFPNASFDTAVAMFVATVVPNPRRLLAEMRRVVRPGGHILFVNHFAAKGGPRWWVEHALAPGSRKLGWHPDLAVEALLEPADRRAAAIMPVPPAGLFTLVQLEN